MTNVLKIKIQSARNCFGWRKSSERLGFRIYSFVFCNNKNVIGMNKKTQSF